MTAAAEPKAGAPLQPRSAARLAVVQALYQMDLASTDINAVIEEFVGGRFGTDDGETGPATVDATFFADILRGVVQHQREIDPLVDQQLATGWRLVRVDAILRAILRAGVLELMCRPDVPARVVINEYVNVAHAFFADDEPKVVNGVLDQLARRLRENELKNRAAHQA